MIPAKASWPPQLVAWAVLLLSITAAPHAWSAEEFADDFKKGRSAPTGWSLSGGHGRWVRRDLLEVTGTGGNVNFWRSDDYHFEPGETYRFEVRARRTGGSGPAIVGPVFANRDCAPSKAWKWFDHVFRAPDGTPEEFLRLGQWKTHGTVQFDRVRIVPTIPLHRAIGDLVLGVGETIQNSRYSFVALFNDAWGNFHRPLQSISAPFNSMRLRLLAGTQVTYRFSLPGCTFRSAAIGFNVRYYVRGACVAEVSPDGERWQSIVTQSNLGTVETELPEALFPASELFVRLRAENDDTSLQVDRIEFHADLVNTLPDAVGDTRFADVDSSMPDLEVDSLVLLETDDRAKRVLQLGVTNAGRRPMSLRLRAKLVETGKPTVELPRQNVRLHAKRSKSLETVLPPEETARRTVMLEIAGVRRSDGVLRASFDHAVSEFYRSDYGHLLSRGDGEPSLWWCDATHKIPRQRPAPTDDGLPVLVTAAKNDHEAVQIVVRPEKPLSGLTATLEYAGGDRNDDPCRGQVEVLRVYYHFVKYPTDATSVSDWWPDALPPLSEPVDVPAGTNQPLWLLFHIPADAPPGEHLYRLRLAAGDWSATVPVRLRVWNFTLPMRNHLETAFGLSLRDIVRYHGLKTDAEKRQVVDLYFKSFADHRISPYDPTPLDPIRVKFLPDANPPAAEVDFSQFDRAMERALERFRFSSFRLPIKGMGGGSFHRQYEVKIGEFEAGTPQYEATFSSYVEQLETHLREKNWLDMAYVYWFDEPALQNYEYVTAGMDRLKNHAPGLRRMLTEEPNEVLTAPVDIWCPVSQLYDHDVAERRRAAGETIWWYVCTSPKAPYCTLFLDHPATDLRVWLWQTWKRKISGVLVWQVNYWTSSAAFPDAPQNPYDDPMGYVSVSSTQRGTKQFWGNGDGRFLYPPLAARTPGASGDAPVIEPPVSSIRWEMLREGIEDYEYLHMLRELIEKRRGSLSDERRQELEKLLAVPASISKEATTFTADPTPIYQRRAAIAKAIEDLRN